MNVEQAAAVEILRGPGSVLYGSSAVHGIINVIPPLPDEIPDLGVALEGGSDDYRRLRFAASQRRRPTAGSAFVMHATDDGGWRDASGFEEQKLNAVWTRALRNRRLKVRSPARTSTRKLRDSSRARRLSRPRDRALESGSRGISRRDVPAPRGALPRRRPARAARVPAQFAHGFPAAFPARTTGRGQRPGQRWRDFHDRATASAAAS